MSKIHRTKRDNPYVQLDKQVLNDPDLSWQAKGLHAYLMSLPDDWQIFVKDLVKRAKNGRDAVRAILSELEKNRYLSRHAARDAQGKIVGMDYMIYEVPWDVDGSGPVDNTGNHPGPGKPGPENQAPGKPGPENPTLQKNKVNKKQNNKEITAASQSDFSDDRAAEISGHCLANSFCDSAAANFSESKKQAGGSSELPPARLAVQAVEPVIGKMLTKRQQGAVAGLVEWLQQKLPGLNICAADLSAALLDTTCYSAAGQDFWKKLNTLKRQAMLGHWQPKRVVTEKITQESAVSEGYQKMREDMQALEIKRESLQHCLQEPIAKASKLFSHSISAEMAEVDTAISVLSAQLQPLAQSTAASGGAA